MAASLTRRPLALLTAAAALAAVGSVAPPAAAAAGRTIYVTPAEVTAGSTGGSTLAGRMQQLRPGDTLVLKAGVYDAGYTRPNVVSGTAAAPITVMADQPAKTLIKGQLKLWDASYWNLRGLRIQATIRGAEALFVGGGTGWTVSGGEFFGGRATGAYTNVGISNGAAGSPSRFRFTANCVHGAGRTTRENQDHNIYVNFRGSPSTGGSIDRNLVFDHPNGAGIKLGFGGEPNARGPWGVRVVNNTFAHGGRQILLHGDVRGNVIQGNLLAYSTKRFQKLPKTTAIYANMIQTKTNRYRYNYVHAASMVLWDPNKAMVGGAGNGLRPSPVFDRVGTCAGYQAESAAARPYGRYGTARY